MASLHSTLSLNEKGGEMNISYRSAKTQVRSSPIHGKGLFARENISKLEIIAIKGGYIIDRHQWSQLEPLMHDSEIQIADEFFIAPVKPAQRDGTMVYINHSCEPNAAIMGQIVYVAMRDIKADEEITADWATTDDLDYTLTCHCGSKACRGTITGKDWMDPVLQKKYQGWFCWFLQRKIDAINKN